MLKINLRKDQQTITKKPEYDAVDAENALRCISPDVSRGDWIRVGMGAKIAGVSFETFDEWSSGGSKYTAASARDAWKSFKADGGVGAGSLFFLARQHGWKPESRASSQKNQLHAVPAPAQAPASKKSRASRFNKNESDAAAERSFKVGCSPLEVWARGEPSTLEHPYLVSKGITTEAFVDIKLLRVLPLNDELKILGEKMAGALMSPCWDGDRLATIQFITTGETEKRLEAAGKKSKLNLPGASFAGYLCTNEIIDGDVVFVFEGIASSITMSNHSRTPSVSAFGIGNFARVAKDLRQKYEQMNVKIVLAPDVGKEKIVEKIAAELGFGLLEMPPDEVENFDVVDLILRDGPDAVDRAIKNIRYPVKAPEPLAIQALENGMDLIAFDLVGGEKIPKKTRAQQYGSDTTDDKKIVNLAIVETPPMPSMRDLGAEYLQRLQNRADGIVEHVDTGFSSIDARWPGLLWNDNLIVLAARPGMGKTAFALQVAEQVAESNRTVLFISQEMRPIDLYERCIARRIRCEVGALRMSSKELDYDLITKTVDNVMSMPLLIDGGPASVDGLMIKINQNILKLDARGLPPLGLIVVDYLQLFAGEGQNRTLEIDYVARSLKQLALRVKSPVLVLAQLNRSLESRTDKRPFASDLRESGGIEQNADSIIMLYRDEYYTREASKEPNIAELICVKNRHGGEGSLKMAFNGPRMMFGDLLNELSGSSNSVCVKVAGNGRRDNVKY